MSGNEPGRAMPKHTLSELALDAIIEIDRALARLEFAPDPIRALGQSLLQTSAPHSRDSQFNLVEPAYFQPFERLFRERRSAIAHSIEEIQSFVRDSASALLAFPKDSVDDGAAEQLRVFCVALHQQLIDELRTEDSVVVQDGGSDDCTTQASLRPA